MPAITCFWLEPVPRAERMLRRYRSSVKLNLPCPAKGYHDAVVTIETIDLSLDKTGSGDDAWPHDDPRWPRTCGCGYVFPETDEWQHNINRLYERSDTKELVVLWGDRTPVGAMWNAHWMGDHYRGPDGRCLCVKTPGGSWMIDGPSSNGGRWKRTGTPPKITVTPSILIGSSPAKYHGWLRDGVLVDA